LDRLIGIEAYATNALGVGGVIKQRVEDFVVEEVLADGSVAQASPLEEEAERKTLGCSLSENRYLLCVLAKRNWDTFSAVKAVADQLGISAARVHIAGIKDAKAATSQHIAVEGVSVQDVQRIQIKDVTVCPLGYVRHKLSAYYLLGNRFQITIRRVRHSKSAIRKRIAATIQELEKLGGVPNFFGHQRFGTTRPITHLVGKAIVRGDFRKAAMSFLAKSSPLEHPESREARQRLQATWDFKLALEIFPKKLRYERLMLKHLAEDPEDFVGAFRSLPAKLRELFPQAYQSLLFNRFLSGRIEKRLRLDEAQVGDCVVGVERSGLPMPAMRKMVDDGNRAEVNAAVRGGRMMVALPLVGFKRRMSQGVQGKIESEILRKEGVNLDGFRIPAARETGLRGDLRAALTPLKDFQIKEVSTDPSEPSGHSVRISFTLRRGSYATVVLREVMKPRNPVKAGF
jgi:tRNA pseudouridine13 synthase